MSPRECLECGLHGVHRLDCPRRAHRRERTALWDVGAMRWVDAATHCARCKLPGGVPVCPRCGEDVNLPDTRGELEDDVRDALRRVFPDGQGDDLLRLVGNLRAVYADVVRVLGREPDEHMSPGECAIVGALVASTFHVELAACGLSPDDRTIEAVGLVVGLLAAWGGRLR